MTTVGESAGTGTVPPAPCQDLFDLLLEAMENCPPPVEGVITQGKLLSRFLGTKLARQAAENLADGLKKLEREDEMNAYDYLEADDLKSVNHDRGRFVRTIMVQGSVLKADRDQFLMWAEDNGVFTAVTSLQIRKAAINDYARKIDKGEHDEIPGLGVFTTKQLRFTPAK